MNVLKMSLMGFFAVAAISFAVEEKTPSKGVFVQVDAKNGVATVYRIDEKLADISKMTKEEKATYQAELRDRVVVAANKIGEIKAPKEEQGLDSVASSKACGYRFYGCAPYYGFRNPWCGCGFNNCWATPGTFYYTTNVVAVTYAYQWNFGCGPYSCGVYYY